MLGLFMFSSDAGVVRRVRAGRKEEFSILVDRYYNLVHSIAFAHTGNTADAEEIAQESFLRAYAGLDSLRDGGRFRAWLGSIARNLSRNRLREQSREVSLSEVAEPATENDAASAELYALLWECIERLDESSREVLVLHYFERMKLRAAADLLDVTPAAAAKRLQRAREALGADLLSRLEQKPQKERNHGRARKTTVAAVAGSVVAWEASATGLSLGGLGLAAAALVLMAGSGAVVYSSFTNEAPVEKAPTVQTSNEPANTPNAAAAAPVVEAEGEAEAAPLAALRTPNGPGTLEVRALRPDGTPAAGLALRVERIDWKENEWPPAQPITEEFTLDEKGEATITGLSFGLHGVVVTGDNLMGVNDIALTKEYPKRTVRLELLPAGPMRGRVTLPDGTPAEGAVVYGHTREDNPSQEFDHGTVAVLRAYADAEGRIALPYVWPGSYRLYARTQDGHAALSDFVSTSEENQITVQAPGALQGQVVMAGTETPAAGVKMMVAGVSRRDGGNVVSDSDGRFAFAQLRPDDYHVYVDDAVMINTDASVEDNVSVAPGAMAEVTIEATSGGVLMGRAYDKFTGVGIPNVHLFFNLHGIKNFDGKNATTDAAGSYYIGALTTDSRTVKLELAEQASGLYLLAPEAKYKAATLEAGKETEVDIPMIPAAVITGKVLQADGSPQGTGSVYAQSDEDTLSVPIKPDGSFRLGAKAGHLLSLWAAGENVKSPYHKFSSVPAEGASDVTLHLTLTHSGKVQGKVRVMGGGGVELKTAEAKLTALDKTCPCDRLASLQGSQSFDMGHVVPGEYELSLVTEFGTPLSGGKSTRITVLPGEVTHAEISLEPAPTRRILGQVVDVRGNAIAGAQVQLSSSLDPVDYQLMEAEAQYSNRRGRFTYSTPVMGKLSLRVQHEDYSSYKGEIEAGDTELKITLEDRVSVSGTVRDARTRAPMSAFSINDEAKSDVGGRFTLENMDASEWVLRFNAPGYRELSYAASPVTLAASAPIEIFMEPGLTFDARVVNSAGQPVEGAALYLYSLENGVPVAVSDAEGRVTLSDLGAEPVVVAIAHPDYASLTEEIYPATTEGEHRFVLDAGGTLECTLELASSDTSWTLTAELASYPQREIALVAESGSGGRRVFKGRLDKIVPGSTELWARLSSAAGAETFRYTHEFPVVIVKGKTTEIRKIIEIPSASLEIVILHDGAPHGLVHAEYRPGISNESTARAVPMGEGVHQFLGLPPGPGSIRISGSMEGAQSFWVEPVNLVAGQTERITLDLGTGATLKLPECEGCIAMIATPEGYAALQEAADVFAETGEVIPFNLPGTLIIPVIESTQQVLVPAGEYHVVLFGGQDEANSPSLPEALPNAVRMNLHTGANGLVPLE